MNWQHQPLIYLSLAGALLAAGMVYYGWQERTRPSRALFIAAQVLVVEMALAHAYQLSRTDLSSALLASQVQMVGVVTIPVIFLVAVAPMNMRRSWLALLPLVALCVVPLITLYLFLFGPVPNMMLQRAWMNDVGHYGRLVLEPGPWFWVHSVYSYGLVLAGLIILGERLLHHPVTYRRKPLLALGALLVINLGHIGINVSMLEGHSSDLVTAATIAMLSVAMWVSFKYNVFDVLPLARDQVLQNLPVGVITLDALGNVLDANQTALLYLGVPLSKLVHRPATEALGAMPQLVQALDHERLTIDFGPDHKPQALDTTRIQVRGHNGEVVGVALVLRDISAEIEANARLRQLGSYIPMCAWCGRARTAVESWEPLVNWLRHEGGLVISHCICDVCLEHFERDPNWRPPMAH